MSFQSVIIVSPMTSFLIVFIYFNLFFYRRLSFLSLFQYPEAKKSLMERGRQLLMKDGLLDEEGLKAAQEQQETLSEKANRLGKYF